MVSNKQYACAYKEVIELLKYVSIQDVKKIPSNVIEYLLKNQDEKYEYSIDKNKSFEEQEKSEITKAIFANFFRDYWATEYQRERILQKERVDEIKIEEEKRKRYNPDAIFKKPEKEEDEINNKVDDINKSKQLIEYKETFFTRFKKFIFKLLGIE